MTNITVLASDPSHCATRSTVLSQCGVTRTVLLPTENCMAQFRDDLTSAFVSIDTHTCAHQEQTTCP